MSTNKNTNKAANTFNPVDVLKKHEDIALIMNTKKGDITPLGVAVAAMLAAGMEYTTDTDKRKAKPDKAAFMVKVMRAANVAIYDKDGKRVFDIYNRARHIRIYGIPAVMEKFPAALISTKADGTKDIATDGPKPLTYSVYVPAESVTKAVEKLIMIFGGNKADKGKADKPDKGKGKADKGKDKGKADKPENKPNKADKPADDKKADKPEITPDKAENKPAAAGK